jgi:hypothetical protein
MKTDKPERARVNESPTPATSDTGLTHERSRAVRSLGGAMRKADPLERIRLEKLKEHLENGSPAHDINRLLKEAV